MAASRKKEKEIKRVSWTWVNGFLACCNNARRISHFACYTGHLRALSCFLFLCRAALRVVRAHQKRAALDFRSAVSRAVSV